MRDNLKSLEYFNYFINEEEQRVCKFSEKLESGEVKESRIFPVKSKIHDIKLGILIARYSKGDEMCLLEEEYLSLLDEWEAVWEPGYYNKNLKMVSLAVLFGISKEYALKIKKMLEKSNVSDWLLSYMLDSMGKIGTDQNKKLLFETDFSTLKKVVCQENKVELLKKYLEKEWYNKDCGCFEAHKSNQNIYYGYWSFEAGAIAKILHIDDSKIKDMLYYPYDLVHYKTNFC